jgi:benzil reductase ((S)-benzoin forming)
LGLALLEAGSSSFDSVVGIGRTPAPQDLAAANLAWIAADLAGPVDWDGRLRGVREIMNATELVFLNNAAVHEMAEVAAPDFDRKLSDAAIVNLIAPAAIAGALVRIADELEAKLSIVHISTGAALRPIEGWGPYCASKAAIAMLFEVLALERPDLTVIQTDPGALDTGMQAAIREGPALPSRDAFRKLADDGLLIAPRIAADRILTALDA